MSVALGDFQGCRQRLVKYYALIYPDMNFSIFGGVVDLFFGGRVIWLTSIFVEIKHM